MIKKFNTLKECEEYFDNCVLVIVDNKIICHENIINPWISDFGHEVGYLQWKKEGGAPEFIVEIKDSK